MIYITGDNIHGDKMYIYIYTYIYICMYLKDTITIYNNHISFIGIFDDIHRLMGDMLGYSGIL